MPSPQARPLIGKIKYIFFKNAQFSFSVVAQSGSIYKHPRDGIFLLFITIANI